MDMAAEIVLVRLPFATCSKQILCCVVGQLTLLRIERLLGGNQELNIAAVANAPTDVMIQYSNETVICPINTVYNSIRVALVGVWSAGCAGSRRGLAHGTTVNVPYTGRNESQCTGSLGLGWDRGIVHVRWVSVEATCIRESSAELNCCCSPSQRGEKTHAEASVRQTAGGVHQGTEANFSDNDLLRASCVCKKSA